MAAICLWATNAFVAKQALAAMTVVQVQALQFAGAAIVFTLARRARPLHVPSAAWLGALLTGVVGLVGTMVFQYVAFAIGPIATFNLLAYAWPLLTAVAVVFLGAARRPGVLLAASAMGFFGVALLMGGAALDFASDRGIAGYAAAVASAVCMAAYSLGAARVSVPPAHMLLPASAIGLAGASLWWVLSGAGLPSPPHAVLGFYLGVGPMGLGYLLWSYAVRLGPVGAISMLGYATPVLSTGLLLLSGERLTSIALLGGVVIVVSCAAVGAMQREAQLSENASRK